MPQVEEGERAGQWGHCGQEQKCRDAECVQECLYNIHEYTYCASQPAFTTLDLAVDYFTFYLISINEITEYKFVHTA